MTPKESLLKGARVLGEFWTAKERCREAWKILPVDADPAYAAGCACEPKGRFCKAKRRWLEVAKEDGRRIEEGDIGIILMMTGSELDASGLTVKFDIPGAGIVSMGQKGQFPRSEMVKLTPDTLPSMLRIIKFFPGSRIADVVFGDVPPQPEEPFPMNGELDEAPTEIS